jgi:hypothetical protein
VEFQENEKEIDDKGKHLEFQVFLRDEDVVPYSLFFLNFLERGYFPVIILILENLSSHSFFFMFFDGLGSIDSFPKWLFGQFEEEII